MLRATLGGLLGEKAQIAAGKEICQAISKQMRAVGKEDVFYSLLPVCFSDLCFILYYTLADHITVTEQKIAIWATKFAHS